MSSYALWYQYSSTMLKSKCLQACQQLCRALWKILTFCAQPGMSLVKPWVPALQGAQGNIFRSHLAAGNEVVLETHFSSISVCVGLLSKPLSLLGVLQHWAPPHLILAPCRGSWAVPSACPVPFPEEQSNLCSCILRMSSPKNSLSWANRHGKVLLPALRHVALENKVIRIKLLAINCRY